MRSASVVAVCSVMVACGLAMSTEERVERAEQALSEREYQAASLDLKRVLQDEPNNVRARRLLGVAFLKMADPASAEAELRRALALGQPVADVQVDLALSLWRQGKSETLLKEIQPDAGLTPAALSEVLTLRGNAYLALGAVLDARASYLGALEAQPENIDASLGVVSTFVQGGDMDLARSELDTLLETYAQTAKVWIASGSLFTSEQDFASAIAHFGTARDLAADQSLTQRRLEALAGLVGAHLKSDDQESATTAIEEYRAIRPNDVTGRVLDAQVQLAKGDNAGAITELETVLKQVPTLGSANFLMGLAQFRTGKLGQAEAYFSAALQANPANAMARKSLAEVRSKLRQGDSAESVLKPLLEADDANALGLAARIRFDSGDYEGGIEYLRRRAESNPEDIAARLDFAAALISGGRAAEAEAILAETNVSATGSDALRGMTLSVLTALAAEDPTRALLEARQAIERFPDDVGPRNLIGRVHQTLGDRESAEARYREAIALDPKDLTAYLNLAGLARLNGDIDASRGHLEAARVQDPKSAIVLAGLSELEAEAGDTDTAIALIEEAIEASPDLAFPRIALGRLLLQTEDLAGARDTLEAAATLDSDNAVPQNLLGFIAAREGDMTAAVEAFSRAAELEPTEARYVINIARAHINAERTDAAQEALQEAYDNGLRAPALVRPLSAFVASDGKLDDAIAIVEGLQAGEQRDVIVNVLKGDLYMGSQLFREAAREYAAAANAIDDWQVAARLMSARARAGLPEPEAALAAYVTDTPQNAMAHFTLAQYYLQTGRQGDAIQSYESMLQNHPDNALALNNLAWIYNERGDARSLDLAARALELAPESAEILDTYGWVLVQRDRTAEGLEYLQRAMTLRPEDPDIRYHVAAALAETGDREAAKSLLESLLSSDSRFQSRSDAEALLGSL